MHPWVRQNEPGLCPICHMELTPVKKKSGEKVQDDKPLYYASVNDPSEVSSTPGKDRFGFDLVPVYAQEVSAGPAVAIESSVQLSMGVRTDRPIIGKLTKKIHALAYLEPPEDATKTATLKVSGWIEKLHVARTGDKVTAGEPLLELYSPELLAAQEELLIASQSSRPQMLVRAKEKLQLLDVPESVIQFVLKNGRVLRTVEFPVPYSGYVLDKNILEGDYYKAGKPLLTIADLSKMWVQVHVYESDFAWLEKGQKVTVRLPYLPDKTYQGVVDYLYPTVDKKTRQRKVRIVVDNDGNLLPGMYADATLSVIMKQKTLLVPDEAIVRSADREVIFVAKPGGKFVPRRVKTGLSGGNGLVEITWGISPFETIVVSGQFLLDSESRSQEAIRKMTQKGKVEVQSSEHAGKQSIAGHIMVETGKDTADKKTHVSIEGLEESAPVTGQRPKPILVKYEICPVMGGKVNKDVYYDYKGYRFLFCCPACVEKFKQNPEQYMKKLKKQGVNVPIPLSSEANIGPQTQPKPTQPIPLDYQTCPVMGGKVNKDVYYDYKGYRFFFCCPGCIEKFKQNPEQYIEKLRAQGVEINL